MKGSGCLPGMWNVEIPEFLVTHAWNVWRITPNVLSSFIDVKNSPRKKIFVTLDIVTCLVGVSKFVISTIPWKLLLTLEVQPPFFMGWFPNQHYFSGGWLHGLMFQGQCNINMLLLFICFCCTGRVSNMPLPQVFVESPRNSDLLNVWTLVGWRMSESSPTKFGVKKVSWRRKGSCFLNVQKIMLWLGVPRATNNRQHQQQQPSTSTTETNNKNINQPPPLINLPFLKKQSSFPPSKKNHGIFSHSDGFPCGENTFPQLLRTFWTRCLA